MKLVLIRFAKADDGTISSRLKEVLAPLESYLSNVSGGRSQRVTMSFDASCIAWFVNVSFASKELVRDIYGVEYMSTHDEVLALELGQDHAAMSLNVPMTWLQKQRSA